MMKSRVSFLLVSLTVGFYAIAPLKANAQPATDVYVMPDQYACVAQMNDTDQNIYGSDSDHTWSKIILWGRTTKNSYINGGYSYSWDYGDGSSPSTWINITNYNGLNPYHPSSEYLSSGQHQYPTKSTDITPYSAQLRIRKNSNGIIESTTTLQVTSMNFSQLNIANGYSASDIPIIKNNMLAQIAKGRGLTTMYLIQDRSASDDNGSWEGKYGMQDVPMSGTAFALCAYLVNDHTVYDPNGRIDAYYDCVTNGYNYLFRKARILPTDSAHDINGNGQRILFAQTPNPPYFNEMQQHGICMHAISLYCNDVTTDPNFKVKVGSGHQNMLFKDVLADAVDCASYEQHDGTKFCQGYGWRLNSGSMGVVLDDCPGPPLWNASTMRRFGTGLYDTSLVVLGLTAIEANWGIKAPPVVRDRLVSLVRTMQIQSKSDGDAALRNEDGGAGGAGDGVDGWQTHKVHIPYSDDIFLDHLIPSDTNTGFRYKIDNVWCENGDYLRDANIFPNSTGPTQACTSALLQIMYYLSLDTTLTQACNCDAPNCKSLSNSPLAADFKLKYNNSSSDYNGSCLRVMGAINWLGRNYNLTYTGDPPLWAMYGMMKALRLYNYQEGGINNGVLGGSTQSLPTLVTTNASAHPWENDFENLILNQMQENNPGDGQWHWRSNVVSGDSDIADAWGVLIISFTPLTPATIKTELQSYKTVKEARVPHNKKLP